MGIVVGAGGHFGMIDKNEIEEKCKEFDIHTSNVQRDYVFGWITPGSG